MQPLAKAVRYIEVPAMKFGDCAPGAYHSWLIDDDHDGAPVYALRMIKLRREKFATTCQSL
jgi:hypothetical protein